MLILKPSLVAVALWTSLYSIAHGKEFVSSAGDFKVELPASPSESIAVTTGNTLLRQIVWKADSSAIIISVQSFRSAKLQSIGAEGYFRTTENQIRMAMANKTITTKSLTHQSLNGRELKVGSPQDNEQLRMRLFFHDRVGYKLLAVGGKDFMNGVEASTFFNSFTLLTSDPIESSKFVPLVDSTAKYKAKMLANARGLAGRPGSADKEVLNVVGANGPMQFYGILHQEAAGIRHGDDHELDKMTNTAINYFTDGDGDLYRRTSIRQVQQGAVKGAELQYRMDSDGSRLQGRRFVNNGRVYWILVGWKDGRGDSSRAKQFFDGFAFTGQ